MKEAYYFSHDANARQDMKIMALMEKYGWEGYGMFWGLIESLRSEPGYKLPNKPYTFRAFERMFNGCSTSVQLFVNDLINEFELLVENDGFIYSESLIRRMSDVDKKREQAREAGKASAAKRFYSKNIPLQPQLEFNGRSTSVEQGKEIKGKEIKEEIYTYSEFYDLELKANEGKKEFLSYSQFVKFIYGDNDFKEKLSVWLNLEKQLSYEQYEKLVEKARKNGKKVSDLILIGYNKPHYLKGKKTIYATLNTWANNTNTK